MFWRRAAVSQSTASVAAVLLMLMVMLVG